MMMPPNNTTTSTGNGTGNNNRSTGSEMKPFRIGMMGAGTVGGGVYELIMGNQQQQQHYHQQRKQRPTMVITKILVRSIDKKRDFQIDTNQTMITTDVESFFCSDDHNNSRTTSTGSDYCDFDCLVEVAGGCTVAKEVMIRAIQTYHIPVITANKAALYEYNQEFQTAIWKSQQQQQQQQKVTTTNQGMLGIEAAVCGGIPIIQLLQTCYMGDRITSICGICNGTTNYILSKMAAAVAAEMTTSKPAASSTSNSLSLYDAALQEAQQLGYAEADPTADVEGYDVRAKIALLAQLAFGGIYIPMSSIPCTGITKVTADDCIIVQSSLPNKYTIKLIGRAYTTTNTTATTTHTTVGVYVTPMLIPCTGSSNRTQLAAVEGCGNAVQVTSDNCATCTYMGPGAGRLPTANSIVADLYRVVDQTLPPLLFDNNNNNNNNNNTTDTTGIVSTEPSVTIVTDYTASFYIRIRDQSSTTNQLRDDLASLLEQWNVTVQHISMPNLASTVVAVDDDTKVNADSGTTAPSFYVITTDVHPISLIQKVCAEIQQQHTSIESILYLPILLE